MRDQIRTNWSKGINRCTRPGMFRTPRGGRIVYRISNIPLLRGLGRVRPYLDKQVNSSPNIGWFSPWFTLLNNGEAWNISCDVGGGQCRRRQKIKNCKTHHTQQSEYSRQLYEYQSSVESGKNCHCGVCSAHLFLYSYIGILSQTIGRRKISREDHWLYQHYELPKGAGWKRPQSCAWT